MTRINVGIHPRYLTDEHLLAEHREIKRLPYFLQKSVENKTLNKIPNKFCLGKGHVLFFIDKQKYLYDRYIKLHEECKRRNFSVTDYSNNFIPYLNYSNYCKDYNPSEKDIKEIFYRIIYKIETSSKKYFHYYGNKISKEQSINLLKNCFLK